MFENFRKSLYQQFGTDKKIWSNFRSHRCCCSVVAYVTCRHTQRAICHKLKINTIQLACRLFSILLHFPGVLFSNVLSGVHRLDFSENKRNICDLLQIGEYSLDPRIVRSFCRMFAIFPLVSRLLLSAAC